MRRTILKFSAFVVALAVIISAGFTVSAEIPYTSYTYWSDIGDEKKEVYNRPMYVTETVFDAKEIGVEDFTSLSDIYTDSNGKIYLLDSNSRIVVLDNKYNLLYEIGLIDNTERYDKASSLYVHTDGTVYICDTISRRVLHTDESGRLLETITLPESSLIPDDFEFLPKYIVVDSKNCTYILSEGSYYGALLYDADKSFLGFYGANTVTTGITGVLTNVMNRIFPNNTKKGNTAQRLPYCFVDIKTDSQGFVYTCNGFTERWERKGQIRKLSPGTGKNIIESEGVNFVDTQMNNEYALGAFSDQDIMNIEINSNGFIYALESTFGKVMLYDADCRMLTSFGGGMHEGNQDGSFVNVSGLALLDDGERVLVSDSTNNNVTVFCLNDYGKEIIRLDTMTLDGDYEQAKAGWEEILKQDNCFQPAYSGIAHAYLIEGDYKSAMEYAKIGYDRDTYATAFEYYRNDFINSHFTLIFTLLFVFIIGAIILLAVSMRKNVVIVKNEKIKFLMGTMIHPSNTFYEVKEKGQGSLFISVIMVVLFYLSVILGTLKGGFLFTEYDPENFNSLWVLARSVGLVVLWIVANWLVCTLLGGRGRLKEICIVTCYSLLPLVIKNFITVILTNVLLPSETNFLTILNAIALIYFVLLMICGLFKIHDFSFGRLVFTSLLSLIGVAIIFFLMIMIIMLFQQTYGFIATVISELLVL
ncbi:MAG: YIP1 family protein [Clostridia bacterium]|nr:YIP1 family protein [Clostridia bacterium]